MSSQYWTMASIKTYPKNYNEAILKSGQNGFKLAKIFGYFPFSFANGKEDDPRVVKLQPSSILFHLIFLSLHVIWIIWFILTIQAGVFSANYIITDAIGYVLCGAIINAAMAFSRLQKLWKKQKFETLWNILTTFHEKLSKILEQDQYLSTSHRRNLENIKKYMDRRIILFSTMCLTGMLVDSFWTVKSGDTDEFYRSVPNCSLYIFWNFFVLCHSANSMLFIFFTQVFHSYFKTLTQCVDARISNSRCYFSTNKSSEKICITAPDEIFVNCILDLYHNLESIVDAFNEWSFTEYGAEIFLCAMQIVTSVYYASTDSDTLKSPFIIFYICLIILYGKIFWDYCVQGSNMSAAGFSIVKSFENLSVRNLSGETKNKVLGSLRFYKSTDKTNTSPISFTLNSRNLK